ncbi:hypothetical protein [Hyalangium versicolor]|uniref:hypothetical protein n=1 Tax=Hyalangium versicolor TaxID=2861190 RepID=UPI001CD024B3|nr:hypothetical protein [Hyalangium versicolor]
MTIFYVAYDLVRPGQNYPRITQRLTELNAQRVLESVWALNVNNTKEEVFNHLRAYIDANDRLLVIEGTNSMWSRNTLGDPNKA